MKMEELILEQLQLINGHLGHIDSRMERLENGMEHMEYRMDNMESRMEHMESRMGHMESRMDSMESRMDSMEMRMEQIEFRMDCVETNIIEFGREQKYIKLILENEIKKNISMIAEGHMNLDRKLNQFREELTDRHLLDIRVAVLEGDVSVLKEKVEVLTA